MTGYSQETSTEKWNRALSFLLEEMIEPDERLRAIAHEKEFYHEYLWIRDQIIEHMHTLWRHQRD